MNINDLSTDETLDILCEITPALGEIITDVEIKKIFVLENGKINFTYDKVKSLIPLLLQKYRENVYTILAALNRKKIEEIKNQSFIVTFEDFNSILTNKELINFFQSFNQ